VYNSALKERSYWYNSRKCQINSCSKISAYIIAADTPLPTYSSQSKALTAYRKTSPRQRVNAALLQQTRLRLEKAFVSIWEHSHRFPQFKKQGTLRSFNFPKLGTTSHQANRFKLPVINLIKVWQDPPFPRRNPQTSSRS
jgi:putative transposase